MTFRVSIAAQWAVSAALAFGFIGSAAKAQTGQPDIVLQPVASGLATPVAIASAGDGSSRLFIVEQPGRIRIFDGTQVLATPFLDIGGTSGPVLDGGERGLLGLAFDPSYVTNGFFYVFYTSKPAGAVTISRFTVSSNANVANPASELILKTQPHADFGNHNGGALAIGSDGCLYAGIGDGGGGGDPLLTGQNLTTLLGKIIRINRTTGAACTAGGANPFISTAGARSEIWALGVRNPWRITFDRQTGDLFIADVGQNAREEVNFQPAGASGRNYCWSSKEGFAIYDPTRTCAIGTPTDPILDYDRTEGQSITGGYRYRGGAIAGLAGTYIYGDFASGRIWGATQNGTSWTSRRLLSTGFLISTFGEDEAGEVYVANYGDGRIYRFVAAAPTNLVAAVLPTARSVVTGQVATAFASIVNPGTVAATACGLAKPASIQGTFSYQTTNTSNIPVGTSNTPVTIPAGSGQSFVFAITPSASVNSVDAPIRFECANVPLVASIAGVNTLLLSASAAASPDMIAISGTLSNDGIVSIPGNAGVTAFAAAAINVGASGSITASVDDGGKGLSLITAVCVSDPVTAACLAPPVASMTFGSATNQVTTLTIQITGSGNVPYNPGSNRLFLRFKTGDGVTRGATSVAVRTVPADQQAAAAR